MRDQSKIRADSVERRIAALSPERKEVLARALRRPSTLADASAPVSASPSIPRRTSNESLPLSCSQQRLWFIDQFAPGMPFYNVSNALRIRFPLSIEALERSYNETVRRHESLRTTFQASNGEPVQVIADELRLVMDVRDLRSLPVPDREREAFRIAAEEMRRPFDLAHGPLVRTSLIQLGAADYLLLLNMHHIVSDGWSMDVFAREITQLYTAFCRGQTSPLPELPIQYADFAVWQRRCLETNQFEKDLAYWKTQLAELPELQLPTDRPRPAVMSYRGARYPVEIPPDLAAAIRELSQREDVTLFTTLLAAFQTLLHRYSGQDEIVVGAPFANRNRRELEGLIGFFVNTVVLRTDLSGDPTFRELLTRVREMTTAALAHQDLPFEKLVEELHPNRDFSRNPLFQVCFQLFNVQTLSKDMFQPCTVEGEVAKFDLRFDLLASTNGISGFLEYSTDLFDAATIARLARHFIALLHGVTTVPDRRISELPILSPAEERQIVVEWNATKSAYPKQCVHEVFAEQAERSPDAIALAFGERRLSYRELNQQADALARYLRTRGVGRDVPVGLFLDRSPQLIVGMLAILKAGGAYVPLDPEYPPDRVAYILDDSGARLVLTDGLFRRSLPDHGAEVVCIGELPGYEAREESQDGAGSESLAYIMYTSGSTGRPKGSAIPHRAITRLVCNTNYVALGPSDRVAHASSISFDAATFEIWAPLLNGGCVVGVPKQVLLSPAALEALLEREQVTTLFLTTDLFHQLAKDRPAMFRGLRTLLVGGSVTSPRWAREVIGQGRPERLLHVYGPTECTTFASWYEVRDVSEDMPSLPIGRPLANTELYVLDRYGNAAPIGAVGELFIGGDGLARGYHNDPTLTVERFVAHPFSDDPAARLYKTGDLVRYRLDDVLDFLGRIDQQVKVRGFRVELGEIESVLNTAPGVTQCVVLAPQDTDGPKRLVAYVEVDKSVNPDGADVRRYLKERLPEYMVPAAFVMMDALPLTPNGKVDRAALKPPALRGEEEPYTEPRTAEEKTLARIWAEVLHVDHVDVHDNFFELGGDSIISIQIVARAAQAGLGVTVRQLFHNPTVAELAAVAHNTADAQPSPEQEALEGEVPLTPVQCWFFEQELAEPDHFNQAVLIETPAGLDAVLLQHATKSLLQHHDALRFRYARGETGWRQFYARSDGPPPLESVDLRVVTESDARVLIEEHAAVAQRSLDLHVGPIVRAIWFDLGDRPGRMLFVVHHLAIDVVSWPILMEDFWKGYEHLASGAQVVLPAKTTSVRQWAQRLHEYAQAARVRDDLAYWIAAASDDAGRLPIELHGGENLAQRTSSVVVGLDEHETKALVQHAPRAYQTRIDDMLLTALAQALGRWTGASSIWIDLEGHGREPLFDDLEISRTVGWFTAIFPVRIELKGTDAGESLKSVKEQLRRIPAGGLTYGVLRYLSSDPRVREQLGSVRTPDVSFNYIGQYPSMPSVESSGPECGGRNRRAHLFEIDGAVSGGRLQMHWRYSEDHHRRATVERVAGDFIERLRALISHCCSTTRQSFTPSDFAAARVSQKDLDRLMATVTPREEPPR